ncbi:MAG: DNA-directed RNA polymerase subunit beta, partial [SAR202 cluster bacterium]|nr:DNA-directed RNA polymerase subunit beta [SAR202 cluster bacterium]
MTLATSSRNNMPIIPSKTYASIPNVVDVPNLIQIQLESFQWFSTEGIQDLLQEVSPIDDFTGNRFDLSFLDHTFKEPKYNMWECREKEITYSAPLYVTGQLKVKETGEIKEQLLFFGDIPIMTPHGTFIINGAERVVVSQLVRSPGAYFSVDVDSGTGRGICSTKIIPYRGAWLEFETGARDLLSVKVDRKRKAPVTTLLRALGYVRDHEIHALFADVDTNPDHQYIAATMEKDPVDFEKLENIRESDLTSLWELVRPGETYDKEGAQVLAGARLEFYRRLRPGEPANVENANALLDSLFFNPRRYDLGKVGRYKLNRRLGSPSPKDVRTLTKEDLVAVIKEMIRISNGQGKADDIDHLGSRRVRAVGELIQNQLRVGILRMERVIKERMTIIEPENVTPAALVNIRPVVAAVREFFGGSQLSQFMDQTNPLAELTHKRRLSALGPGGLSRERAGFEVRDVHNSHYGRICPIETPEGPNIGLLGSLATYGHINEFGFIETPYRRVLRELSSSDLDLVGRSVWTDLLDGDGKVLIKAGKTITKKLFEQVQALPAQQIALRPFVTNKPEDIVSMQADDEEVHVIAQANIPLDSKGQFIPDKVETRTNSLPTIQPVEELELMDISPMQIVSVSTSLIPFLEHDDANRALMGSNMQRQAVPLLKPEAPLVGTGMERRVALDSGQVVLSQTDGTVTGVSGNEVIVTDKHKNDLRYTLVKFLRSNQSTCVNQRPVVTVGQKVNIGDPLADSSSTDQGDLALGHNVLVAFMSWEGYNYEDAIIIGEALIQDDKFTSIHIEKYECEARQTKLGDEEITRDIPNIGEETLRDLDEEGVIRVGAEVGPGDILVGKITPKGETELTAEEKLLRAIFGEKARDVKDTSLRVPHGERGKIIDVRVSDRENKEELSPGVNRMVRVWIAQTRKLTVGDKMAGRHGNKGVVSRILPVEDMPYLENGTPAQIVLNPIGVPSRMNLGQVLETHLGWVANFMGFRAVSPVFDGATDADIEDGLGRVWMIQTSGGVNWHNPESPTLEWDQIYSWIRDQGYDPEPLFDEKIHGKARVVCMEIWLKNEAGLDPSKMDYPEMQQEAKRLSREQSMTPPILGKMTLRDGRTGEEFAQPVTVGYIYIMKLIHLVEDKIHARSTGPYSLITQQPLGGKAQFGGQRFGEMEVWALEAYSFAYNLQEMLTVKSDDVVGRQKTYEAIVKGEDIIHPGIPESFQVLLKEMQALGLSMELLSDEEGFDLEESLHHPPLGDVLSDEIDDSDIAAIVAELDPPVV